MEWVTAREAIGILADYCHGHQAEARSLRAGAATGAVPAKADHMVRWVKPSFMEPEQPISTETHRDWIVPLDFWAGLDLFYQSELEHGRVQSSDSARRVETELTGVRFEKDALAVYVATLGVPAVSNAKEKLASDALQRLTTEWMARAQTILSPPPKSGAHLPHTTAGEERSKSPGLPTNFSAKLPTVHAPQTLETEVRKATTTMRKKGRPKGVGSYSDRDAGLIDMMHDLIKSKKASGRWVAATECAKDALGGGTLESRARRLLDRYNEKYPGED